MDTAPFFVRTGWKRLFLGMCFLVLAGPLALAAFRSGESDFGSGGKVVHPFPKLGLKDGSWRDFPAAFEAFYDDHFRLRGFYMRIFAFDSWHLFRVSSSSKVLIGHQGWLYYNDTDDFDPIATYQGKNLFTPAELDAAFSSLVAWRDWLQARGIAFVVCVAPEKTTIYPEYLPSGLRVSPRRNRTDQFIERCAAPGGIPVVDLRGPVLEAKARGEGPLYFHTDTHWNPAGAFIGASKVLEAAAVLLPAVHPRPASDFLTERRPAPLGDLARMIGVETGLSDVTVAYSPRFVSQVKAVPGRRDQGILVMEQPRPDLPRAMVCRDSFTGGMIPFLSEAFRHTTYIWDHQLDPRFIEQDKPDVVVLEMVERYVAAAVEMMPPEEMLRSYSSSPYVEPAQ